MKMIKAAGWVWAAAAGMMLASCATYDSSVKSEAKSALYVCGCGADCKCNTVRTQPGKCGCGHDLVDGEVKKVEAETALVCMCHAGCKCALDAKDPSKCGCGKEIRKVSLKGTGIYYCNCGGACCTVVSDQPGQCKCGKELKKAG